MKKQLLIASAFAIPTIALGAGAYAMQGNSEMHTEFVDKISSRFSLNPDEVRTFLEEEKNAKIAERESKIAETLKTAGFSDEQIKALSEKKQAQRSEMESWRDKNPNATSEEIKTQRENNKKELETWATEQGIDLTKVRTALESAGIGRGMHKAQHGKN